MFHPLGQKETVCPATIIPRVNLETSVEDLAEDPRDAEGFTLSLINDVKRATKHELRILINAKVDTLNHLIEKMKDKLVSLEKATDIFRNKIIH